MAAIFNFYNNRFSTPLKTGKEKMYNHAEISGHLQYTIPSVSRIEKKAIGVLRKQFSKIGMDS